MKKWTALALVGMMVLTLLTGCGATTDTSITKTTQKVKKTSVRKNDDDNTKVLDNM